MNEQRAIPDRMIVLSVTVTGTRGLLLEVGSPYLVQPRDARRGRHRGRRCVILEFVPLSEDYPFVSMARVRFSDTLGVSRVALEDLVEVESDWPWPS
jgi:hypothetical protein